jgi:pimeloyl-ACP methyl ester carboxylesterase
MRTVVVYVHGLWQRGAEAVLLRQRLSDALLAEAPAFSYPSVSVDATANAGSLAAYLAAIDADRLHLVGHSLGGLVISKVFETDPGLHARLPPGRIVMLGPPLGGSRTARKLARLPLGARIMGRSVAEELLVPRERRWQVPRELGVIAGNFGVGLGLLLGRLGAPSDGTILVEETALSGTTQRLVLRVSHTGMLLSGAVAARAAEFLSTGRFGG